MDAKTLPVGTRVKATGGAWSTTERGTEGTVVRCDDPVQDHIPIYVRFDDGHEWWVQCDNPNEGIGVTPIETSSNALYQTSAQTDTVLTVIDPDWFKSGVVMVRAERKNKGVAVAISLDEVDDLITALQYAKARKEGTV